MKAFFLVALMLGSVIGYNCYLHVWKNDLTSSVMAAVVSWLAFTLWFARISRGGAGSID